MKIRDGDQERQVVSYFCKLIAPWRKAFTEDNWPTTAAHLHELLHRAMIEQGAQPQHIAFLAQPEWDRGAARMAAIAANQRLQEDREDGEP